MVTVMGTDMDTGTVMDMDMVTDMDMDIGTGGMDITMGHRHFIYVPEHWYGYGWHHRHHHRE